MPVVRHDDVLLRVLRDVNDIRANLRRIVANLPLYDIANENTPAQITSNQNNYVPGNYDVLRLSSSKVVQITGIANGVKGRSLRIINSGNYVITFKDESASSLAKNRFSIPRYTVQLQPLDSVTFYYDSTAQRWTLVSTSPANAPSADPLLWTLRDSVPVSGLSDVCWSPELGVFIAAQGGTSGLISSNGITWTSITFSGNINAVTWSSTLNLFVGVGNNAISTSTNGTVWSAQVVPAANNWTAVCWSATLGLFAAVSSSGTANRVMTSANGIAWATQVSAEDRTWQNIIWADSLGLFIAVNSTVTPNGIMTSPNGTAWTARASGNGYGLAWSPTLGLAISVDGSGIYKSLNGTVWSAVTPPTKWAAVVSPPADVVWLEDIDIFVATKTNCSAWSTDGVTWYDFGTTPGSGAGDLAYSEELGMVVGVSSNATNRIITAT